MHTSIFRKILLIPLFFSSFSVLLSLTSKDLEKDAILINFAKAIDPQKMYFIEKDINDLLFRFSNSTKYFLEKGNLYPAYEAYDLYKNKVKQRTDWICEYLDSSFSFTNPSFFYSDRTESNWSLDELEANALWARFLKHQLLNELLSVSSDETSFEDSPIAHVKATNILLRQLLNDSVFYEKKLNEAKNKIKRRYSRNLKALDNREASDIQEAFINSITNLFDPHSAFLSSHSLEEFQTQVKNSFVGIGAVLEDVDGICTIKEILPGGPAERSKELNPEDEIHGVAQGEGPIEDVVDMNLKYIVRKIKGAKGTTVRLEINPGGVSNSASKKTISLIRDEIKITENLASAKIIKTPHKENSLILI